MSTPVRCRTVFHAVILATALTATLAVPPAHAHSPCDPTDNDRAEASRVLAGLTREIDVMEATIVEALRLQTGQLSGYAAQSAKAVTGALDAQTKLQAQIAREVEETRAMRARRPTDSGCAAITGLAGLAAARQAAESAYVRAADAETGRIAGDRAAVPDAGATAGNAARFESLTSTYCNGARAGEDAALCRGGDALHAADLKAGNLFDRRTFANEAELRTAVELSRNLDGARGARSACAGLRRDRSGAPPHPARPLRRRPRRSGRRLLRPCPRVARTGRHARNLGRPGRAGTRCGNPGQPL